MKKGLRGKMFCVVISIILLISCGGGGGDSIAPTSDTSSSLTGVASKGIISGGSVEVYAINDNGQKGSLLGSTTTDSDGTYTLRIDHDGPILVEVTGGKYIDEATGVETDLVGTLRAALPSVDGDVNVAVTPLTEIAVRIAESSESMDSIMIGDANDLLSQILGGDIISTMPTDCSDSTKFGAASVGAQNYAMLLAAISQLAETSGQNLSDVIDAIQEDLADMAMDQTSNDLLTAIGDFLVSGDNKTGVQDASGLVAVIEDTMNNGLVPIYRTGGYFLQYRNHDDPSVNYVRGYLVVTKSGLPIVMEDIDDLIITDANGNEISVSNIRVWPGNYYSYDCLIAPCSESGPYKQSGILGSMENLAAGAYQIKILTTDGQSIIKDMVYPGQLALPVVDRLTQQSQWLNGDLILSWTNPITAGNWSEVDQLRIVLYDGSGHDVLYISTNVTDETITIPADLVKKATVLGLGGVTTWEIQTRAYDDNGMNSARGVSDTKELSYSIAYSYLQYRTFEDPVSNQYRAWMEVQTDGGMAAVGEFSNFRVFDSTENQITPSNTPSFWQSPFPYLFYDCRNTPCTSRTYLESGFTARFDNLSAGSYRLMADSPEGALTAHVKFPGKVEIPVVASSSLQVQELISGDVVLSWTNPTSETNWSEVDQLRLVLTNNSGTEVIVVGVYPDTDTVTIPVSIIDQAVATGGEITGWTIQTRAYDENSNNYARGLSFY